MRTKQFMYPKSLLQRLSNDVGSNTTRKEAAFYQDVEEVYIAIKENLEVLLNSRATLLLDKHTYPLLVKSVVNYGVTDLTNYIADSNVSKLKLCDSIADTIRQFEPRLYAIEVSANDAIASMNRQLRIQITANIKPYKERKAVFETNLNFIKQQFAFM